MTSEEREIERQERVRAILENIRTKEEKKVINGLKTLKSEGDDGVIIELIKVWMTGLTPKAEKEMISFFNDLKSNSSAEAIMEILEDEQFSSLHTTLLNTVWNSSVDYSPYIASFVEYAIERDFMAALECLTIIENLTGPFEEEHIFEAEIKLREYADKQQKEKNEDDQKLHLIHEIEHIILSNKFQ